MQNIWGINPQGWASDVRMAGNFLAEFGQLFLRSLPREVDVGLSEASLGQAVEAGWGSEGLREEDDLRIGFVNGFNQPFPEVARLGVGVIHAEDLDSTLDPKLHYTQNLCVQALGIVVEIQRVDVLVLLRRILGVGNGAVRQDGEPLRVSLSPRVVRCTLER